LLEAGSNLRPASRAAADQSRFVAIYLIASIGWIVATDWVIGHLGLSMMNTSVVHTLKGLAYVALVGMLLGRLVGHYVRSAEVAQQEALDAQLELVTKLARAVEYRDDETGGHNERIACYVRIVARELGLEEEVCEMISFASVLHDVGKIGIPDAILLKPGPLSPSERKIIERHTVLGAVLLDGTTHALGKLARLVALTHHERWDGSGYPQGLIGEAIPLEGRIVAVCDVYDALTSKRLYKSAWSSELAIAEITRASGESFDPEVVQAFLRALPEIRAIQTVKTVAVERPRLLDQGAAA
jgi:putative two-component system response regulator